MLENVLKTTQAARYVGLSKPTLERYRTMGGGPRYLKLGKAVRYRTEDLDIWMAIRLVNSTSETVKPR
ncbi:helix-turn-helix transcriptional regulator [Novosphingobium sp. KACC 22771]|uniref:helix-turn-helix transcriptional regulator n=1 Tax=Novosphingobium sp. KACC 22771 TaxID=3025670 RepID=UPI00236642EA|nr:helix-turn-helix domain-containing protein [Novosphingobium sp. KACC 22771]WDF73938.1 helix-turn-helix domain-containing protein [Novosphingobium sp. KACC 22771]